MEQQNPSVYRIQDMIEAERPRERLASQGPAVLSIAELLAIILRTGVKGENAVQMGHRLLRKYQGLQGLHRVDLHTLSREKGIGIAKASQIIAALEVGKRLSAEPRAKAVNISSPSEVADLVKYEMSPLLQEELRVILLDTRNRVMEIVLLYRGSLNSSSVRVGEVFKAAIQRSAASIILVHNHPSGDTNPSPEDITLTRAVQEAGKLMDIALLDHLIIGNYAYLSLKEKGVIG